MAFSGEFLAKIRLALEGKEEVVGGLVEVQQTTQQMTSKQVEFPWLQNLPSQTAAAKASVVEFGKELEGFAQVGQKLNTVWTNGEPAGAKSIQIFKNQAGAIKQVTTEFDNGGKVIGQSLQQIYKGASQSAGIMEQLGLAMRRALIVAPVWMIMRAAIQGVTSTISDGFATMENFDKAMIKNKAVILTTGQSVNSAMAELGDTIRTFSKDSGVSLDTIAKAFYRFGTVGIQFKDAMGGAIASTKLAMATQGDADTIARALAMTYRLLGDTVDSSLSPMEKQEAIAGRIFKLWKTNAFEANEFAQSLGNFVGTAKIANFTADQTVTLLAALGTAGVQGARGGTLLRSAVQKLVENLGQLAPLLGLSVNPEVENLFDVLMRVLGALHSLSQTKGIPTAALDAMREIFGGTRGTQPIAALNALFESLTKDLSEVGKNSENISLLNSRVEEVKNSISGQLEIFRNYKKLIGEAFVVGVVGGADFKDSLKDINAFLKDSIDNVQAFGGALRFTGNFFTGRGLIQAQIQEEKEREASANRLAAFQQQVLSAIQGQLATEQVLEVLTQAHTKFTDEELGGRERIVEALSKQYQIQLASSEASKDVSGEQKRTDLITEASKKRQEDLEFNRLLSVDLQHKLDLAKQDLKYQQLHKAGVSDLDISYLKLNSIVSKLVETHNNLVDASGALVPPIDEQIVKSLILNNQYKELFELMPELPKQEKELNRVLEESIQISKNKATLQEEELEGELALLRIRGVSESTLVRTALAMKSVVFGEDAVTRSLSNRLEMEKLITREKLNQVEVGNDTLTLYRVAQEQGIEVARQLGSFLTGQIDFGSLQEMPRVFEAFKQYFASRFEAFQAASFFGIPFRGEGQLGGRRNIGAAGSSVPIPEFANVGQINIPSIQNSVAIQGLNIAVTSAINEKNTPREQAQKIIEDIAAAIRTDANVQSALAERIENF
jgi:TP901 family phage tail tape measure protein